MTSLIVATIYLIVASGLIKLEDVKTIVFPVATMLAWHIYYVGQFLSTEFDAVLMDCPEQYTALTVASIITMVLLCRRGVILRRAL